MGRLIQATIAKARQAIKPASLAANRPAASSLAKQSLASSVFSDLLGKPFSAGARGPSSYDCVGIVLTIAARLGKQVPDYASSEAELHSQLSVAGSELADCPQVKTPAPGCVVLFQITPGQHHMGIMVDAYRMIHCADPAGVVIESIMSPLWKRRVLGFYTLETAS
jgi:cell wall-associated NlpC family hydrolase